MTKKRRDLGNETYFTVFNSDMKLIKDPVKKILYAKIKNWIYRNEDKKSAYHYKVGYWWTFGTYEYWAEECGLETKTVGKHLRGLVSSGILKTGNYNKKGYDKTIWYRLATADELKKVNFQVLFYGNTFKKNSNKHSNDTLLQMYQNGMTYVTKKDIEKEHLGVPIPDYIPEYTLEDISDDKPEYILEDKSDNIFKNELTIIEEYNQLNNDDNILNHYNLLSKIDIEKISTDTIKKFIDKFHEKSIDSIGSENDLSYFKCRFDKLNESTLTRDQTNYCFKLISNYYNLIIAPQPAELNYDEMTSISASSPQIPLNPSSQINFNSFG
jgi:hypothetical protein